MGNSIMIPIVWSLYTVSTYQWWAHLRRIKDHQNQWNSATHRHSFNAVGPHSNWYQRKVDQTGVQNCWHNGYLPIALAGCCSSVTSLGSQVHSWSWPISSNCNQIQLVIGSMTKSTQHQPLWTSHYHHKSFWANNCQYYVIIMVHRYCQTVSLHKHQSII